MEDMQSIVFENNTINPKGEPVMRCRWQMKRGGEGAAVKIVNNYVVSDDFGHRKRALVQILPPKPTGSDRTQTLIFGRFFR